MIIEIKDSTLPDLAHKCDACCLSPRDKPCSELEEENGLTDCKDGHHYGEEIK